jgi:predicted HicB family RNase H-like nuclease
MDVCSEPIRAVGVMDMDDFENVEKRPARITKPMITVRVPIEMRAAANREAARRGVSLNRMVAELIEAAIEKSEGRQRSGSK